MEHEIYELDQETGEIGQIKTDNITGTYDMAYVYADGVYFEKKPTSIALIKRILVRVSDKAHLPKHLNLNSGKFKPYFNKSLGCMVNSHSEMMNIADKEGLQPVGSIDEIKRYAAKKHAEKIKEYKAGLKNKIVDKIKKIQQGKKYYNELKTKCDRGVTE